MKFFTLICAIALGWLLIWVPIFGLHHVTGQGSHVGYITATENSGVFYKTNTVYVKTDTQSSQEDSYCVIDPAIFDKLTDAAVSKEKVEVKYTSYFSTSFKECSQSDTVITDVIPLK